MNIVSKASNDLTSQGRNLVARLLACGNLPRLAASLAGGLALGLLPSVQAQTTPSAVILKSTTLVSINGNAGHIAANNAGDAFYVSQTDNVAYWLKRGTTTPIPLVTGLSGGRSVYVDPTNNVYVPSN